MFHRVDNSNKKEFLDKAKQARDERAGDKQKDAAATKIQVWTLCNFSKNSLVVWLANVVCS